MEPRLCPLLVMLSWSIHSLFVSANTEHKVHNIVLYPDKHSWCKTTAIKQVIGYPGCDSIEMDNNVCVGACFSYSIPRTVPSSPGEVLPYCDSCQPSNTTIKHVTLKCSNGEFEGEILKKKVEIITNCSCMTCTDSSTRRLQFDLDEDSDAQENADSLLDVPQLFGLLHSPQDKNDSLQMFDKNYSTNTINESIVNEKLLLWLKELNEGIDDVNSSNQLALREILNQVESEHHRVDDVSLADFVKRVEKEGHIKIDVERLRQVLVKMEHQSDTERRDHHHGYNHNAHRHQHRHGPHHSLVMEPEGHDMIQTGVYLTPTLDVESHHLKPALAGSELSYHDNLAPTNTERESLALSDNNQNTNL